MPETGRGAVPPPPRLESVDLVRGLVMVIMALDHSRDFFGAASRLGDPELLPDPGLALFLTRWITHFCAPAFVFLAGTSAFLSLGRGRTTADLRRFLLTRGLWLVLLEYTVVGWAWSFSPTLHFAAVQVIWALGVSMVVLAGLVHLPAGTVAALGLVMIAGHNLFDGVAPESLGRFADVWRLLHVQGLLGGADAAAAPRWLTVYVRYPLVPWIGVMAAGYGFGPLMRGAADVRQRRLLRLGLAFTALFVVLRLLNVYGDPRPWAVHPRASDTLIAFLNTQKYPPSLLYLLMTLGPTLVLLALAERWRGRLAGVFVTFGRVPLAYYVVHVALIHALVFPAALLRYGPGILARASSGAPADWGFGLPVVYAVWLGVVLLLYPACRWFAGVKARRRDWWLSYL